MPESIPVERADTLDAWRVFYSRADEFEHIEVIPPHPNDPYDQHTLTKLALVLENDRQRCADRIARNPNAGPVSAESPGSTDDVNTLEQHVPSVEVIS